MPHADLHYLLEGPEDAPVLILSNSLGTDLHLWDAQMPTLVQHFRVLRYDTRGHGLSALIPGDCTLADLGADVLALADRLGIEHFHVCGVSLGGMTALWLAIHAPARVRSLMACCTAAQIGNAEGWNARIEQVRVHGMASIADATMERWFTPSFRERAPKRVATMRAMLLQTAPEAYAACCAALRDADLTAALGSIVAPTFIISGTHDVVTPPADGHLLQAQIPGARYCELDSSHIANVEAADEFQAAMLSFLAAI